MIIEKILEKRRIQLEREKAFISPKQMNTLAKQNKRKIIDFKQAIKLEPINVIAELKKASPSKGLICKDFSPVEIAIEYEKAGASALSVLTEEYYFQGKGEYIRQIRKVSSLPILRKDFILEDYQIEEAVVLGADAILLIATILDKQKLSHLLEVANQYGLYCMVEVHTKEDLEKVLQTKADIIGINNRNLKTFQVDIDTTTKLIQYIPKDKVVVAESGIASYEDIQQVKKAGVHAALIGESLIKSKDKRQAIRRLIGHG